MSRGRPGLFWIAFGAVLAAGVAIVFSVRSFFDTLTPLWISMGLSLIALVLGVLAATLPRRGDG